MFIHGGSNQTACSGCTWKACGGSNEQLVEDSAVDPKEELFWVPIVDRQGNPFVKLV